MVLQHSKEIEVNDDIYAVEGETEWTYDSLYKIWELERVALSVVNVYDDKEVEKSVAQKVIDTFIETIDPYWENDHSDLIDDTEYNMER